MADTDSALKRCRVCGESKPLDQFHRDRARRDGRQTICKACGTVHERKRYADNREAFAVYRRQQYAKNRDEALEYSRQYGADLKAAVFEHYGRVCTCCGATEDLTIDHINGNGREYREDLFGHNKAGGAAVYRWIIANGFPDDLQTLCRPCNRSKGIGERCQLSHPPAGVSARPCGHSWADTRLGRSDCPVCHRDRERARYARLKDSTITTEPLGANC
jgi:5-methylcytosine-specific restriction endonuclease McrA